MFAGLVALGLLFGLFWLAIYVVLAVLFLLNLQRLLEAVQPQNREMSPGLVWLNIIPVWNLGWAVYTVIKIKNSVGRENASLHGRPVDEGSTHTIGLVSSILFIVSAVFSFGGYASRGVSGLSGLISLAALITLIIYWVKTSRLKNELLQARGGGYGQPGQYGPGGQYGAGAPPYGQGGAPYGQGGQPYGQGGPGYGAGYGVGQGQGYGAGNAPAGAPGPAGQPQSDAPPAEAPQSGRTCSQCGQELDADDQFCTTCGAPAPKE